MLIDEMLEILDEIATDTFLYDVRMNLTTTAQDIDGWDSLSHTIFIMKIEQRFGITLPIEQTLGLNNVGELVTFILDNLALKERR